jgi:hypothetical protein
MFHAKSERGKITDSLFPCRTLVSGTHNRSQCNLVKLVPCGLEHSRWSIFVPHDCEALASGKKSGWPLIL